MLALVFVSSIKDTTPLELLLLTWFSFIPSMHYIHYKVWDEIIYPFPNLGMDKKFHLTLHPICNYLSRLGLKLTHVCKWGH